MSQTDIIARLYATLAQYEDVSPEQGQHPTFGETIRTLGDILAPYLPTDYSRLKMAESIGGVPTIHRGANVFAALRRANADRQDLWCVGTGVPDLAFRGLELAGEAGELANVVKKIERERLGWPGSRATVADAAAELGDVVICADLIATQLGLQLDRCVIDKFNQTSVDRGYEIYIGDYTAKAEDTGLDAVRQRVVDRLKRDPAMRAALRPEHDDRLRPMEANCADAKHEEVAREGRVPRKGESRPNLVVFLNGDARSGKDTVAAMMAEQLEARGWKAEAVSSIEPVRAMLTLAGIDVTAKTEKDRFLLSEIGDRVEEHSNFRSDFCVETYIDGERAARQEDKPYALILHTREPETIHKIAFKLRHENVETHTLFVAGRGTPISSNKADSKVRNMDYDMELLNDASLEDLRGRVLHVVKALTN